MRAIFKNALWLLVLWGVGVGAQVPMEAVVSFTVRSAPRSSAKTAVTTLSNSKLIGAMGLSGGGIVCVGDASDPSAPWTFKHVVPATKGGSAVETDLSDSISMEVLGYSDVGNPKEASSAAPTKDVMLGMVTRTQTVRMGILYGEKRSEVWGSMVVRYLVKQLAGKTGTVWMAGAGSFSGVGTSDDGSGELGWSSASGTMGVFKVSTTSGSGGAVGEGMVLVKGGTLPSGSELAGEVVGDFRIGKCEVTWGEWKAVRDWAVTKGYDLSGVGAGSGEDHPVRDVNWYQVVKWCNARSEKEGKTAVYTVGGAVYRTGESEPTVGASGNGYRLPLEKEWEWAARGGVSSKGYEYSGSNDLNEVGWYWENSVGASVDLWSGYGTWPVGKKKGNELGLYDMSGNVFEWCFDAWGADRVDRGGGWGSTASYCPVVDRNFNTPTNSSTSNGFRVASSSVP
jgi:formylglycine-generating enzyme required for sulfatase activity